MSCKSEYSLNRTLSTRVRFRKLYSKFVYSFSWSSFIKCLSGGFAGLGLKLGKLDVRGLSPGLLVRSAKRRLVRPPACCPRINKQIMDSVFRFEKKMLQYHHLACLLYGVKECMPISSPGVNWPNREHRECLSSCHFCLILHIGLVSAVNNTGDAEIGLQKNTFCNSLASTSLPAGTTLSFVRPVPVWTPWVAGY
jgi:hypothetical protein